MPNWTLRFRRLCWHYSGEITVESSQKRTMLTPEAKRQLKKATYGSLVMSVVLGGFYVFSCWLSVRSNGGDEIFQIASALVVIFGLGMLSVFLSIPVQLLFLLLRKPAIAEKAGFKGGKLGLAGSVIFLFIFGVLGILSLRMGDRIRDTAFRTIAASGEPLVKAIKQFEAAKGSPPATLNDLVPNFIPAIPKTGIGAHPSYEFLRNQSNSNRAENSWALFVRVDTTPLSETFVAFFPNQDYPTQGRFKTSSGNWALVYSINDEGKENPGMTNLLR